MGFGGIDDRLAQERRARLQAERLLALRSEELYSANRKLAEHAHALSHQVIEQREENAALRGQSEEAAAALDIATDRAVLAERRLWDALTAAEDGFAIFDTDCRLVIANPAWLAPFDGMTDVAPGASYEAILRIATDEGIVDLQGEGPDDWIDRMLARWEIAPIPQEDIRLFNGTFIRLIDKRTPQGDTVCLGLDITRTIEREQALREARDAALAASRAKSTFLANMSHEIRTPMNGVVSMADMLRETGLTEEQALYAETIRNSGEALLVIINDILDYSKIEAGKMVLHRDAFDLPAMISEIFRLLRPTIAGRDLDLRLDYDPFLPDRMIGDRGRVRQVLTNLIGNAVKFTEAGHVIVRVVGDPPPPAGTSPSRLTLRVMVEDTGIGIPPDMQKHVFGEFNQVEDQANRRHDGTGLGLAISYRLVKMMGGEMWLDSTLGQGSALGFRISFDVDPRAGGDPVPPLPDGTGPVYLVGDGGEVAHAIGAKLARLRVDMRHVSSLPPPDVCAGASAFIWTQPPDDPPKTHAALQAAGMSGLTACLVTGPTPDLPDWLTPLEASISLGDLAAMLTMAPSPESSGQKAVPNRRLRVLAAEDNKTNQMVLRALLKTCDLDLTMVNDGAALVAAYQSDPPDLILTDISMPGMDGTEATRRIREIEASRGAPPVPIIAMTAHALDEDRQRILANGLDGYMTKPLRKEVLLSNIAAHLPPGCTPVTPR